MLIHSIWGAIPYLTNWPYQYVGVAEQIDAVACATPSKAQVDAFFATPFYQRNVQLANLLAPELASEQPHVALLTTHGYRRQLERIERASLPPTLAPNALVRLAQNLYAPSPLLLFWLAARTHSLLQLALLASRLTSTYYVVPTDNEPRGELRQRPEPLATLETLAAFAEEMPKNGRAFKLLKEALAYAIPNTASPRELALAANLSFPQKLGGAGLPKPSCNHEVVLTKDARHLVENAHHISLDLFWARKKFALEYDSVKHHSTRHSVAHDKNREAAAAAMGIEIVPVTARALLQKQAKLALAKLVAKKLGVALCVSQEDWVRKSRQLETALAQTPLGL